MGNAHESNSKWKYLFYVVSTSLLIYFVYGAVNGVIVLAGRSGVLTFTGQAAWVACASPMLLLLGDIVRYSSKIDMELLYRKIISYTAYTAAVVIFFYVVIFL